MKRNFVVLLMVLISLSVFSQKKSKPVKLKTSHDTISYCLGLDIARNLAMSGVKDLNIDILSRALKDAIDSNSQFDDDATKKIIQDYFNKLKEQQNKEAIEEGKKFLEENAKKEGVITTESGLQYKVIKQGNGPKPKATDKVKVHYTGKLINGKVFDSSVQRGQPLEFPLNRVIKGWTEGLQLMPVGSKYIFYIPYNLAYGERGAGKDIPPYATLVFEVELLDILDIVE